MIDLCDYRDYIILKQNYELRKSTVYAKNQISSFLIFISN